MFIRAARQIAVWAAGAVAGLCLAAPVQAQTQDEFPKQTITFVCAFPPGSGADILVRYWANRLKDSVGVPIVVQNKPGAMAHIAAEFTARSKPDGHTILIHAGSSVAANMHIFRKPSFDVVKDLRVAATLSRHSYMLVVAKESPHRTLADLTAALRAKGDKGTYGTANTPSFVIGKLFAKNAGLQSMQVNYRTSMEFLNDLKSGTVDFAVTDAISALALEKQGHWRMLAIGSGERMNATPNLPTFKEGGVPGIDLVTWWGAMVPAGTPDPVVAKINQWFAEALKGADTVEFLREQGNDAMATPLPEAAQMLRRSEQEWKTLVDATGVEKI